ncbi:MAG: hypothetical protein ACYC1E_13160 [Propionibacteriaceae bacterium]
MLRKIERCLHGSVKADALTLAAELLDKAERLLDAAERRLEMDAAETRVLDLIDSDEAEADELLTLAEDLATQADALLGPALAGTETGEVVAQASRNLVEARGLLVALPRVNPEVRAQQHRLKALRTHCDHLKKFLSTS